MLLGLMWSTVVFLGYFVVYRLSVGLFFYGCSLMNKASMVGQFSSAASGIGLLILIGMPPFLGFLVKVLVFLIRESLLITVCIIGSVIRLKFYIDFFYRIITKRIVDKNKTEIKLIWAFVVGANLIGVILVLTVLR